MNHEAGPPWLPAVLDGLGVAVLERLPERGGFRSLGRLPDWFREAFGPVGARFPGEVPFLQDFVENAAEACWSSGTRSCKSSGLWTEPGGGAYEARAIARDGQELLTIERCGERLLREQGYIQRLHEDALEKRRLAKEVEKKEILLDCIVHDLSGPLATILMNLQHVSRQMERQDLREGLERAIGQAERQRALIRCIGEVFALDLPAPLLSKALRGDKNGVSLLSLARQLASAHEAGARERGIMIRVSGSDGWVAGESGQAARILENLLVNALRYSPEGGIIEINVEESEDKVGLEVRDEGPGVPVELRGKLFRPYAKAGSNGGQAGLGLYFCHLVTTLWGGSIAYADRPGGGACFRINLPGTQPSTGEGMS